MIEKIFLYLSNEKNPYINLAIENWLLDWVDDSSLILYLWQNENTAVIGRNQNPWAELDLTSLRADGGRVARRQSGGGAVYHDLGNLNFTFISSTGNADTSRNMKIIQSALKQEGIEAEISGRNDITANGKKFSGNAFYNSKNKSYHHGTILISSDKEKIAKYLTPSKAKLESKGVKSVKSRVVNLTEINPRITVKSMAESLKNALENHFNLIAEPIENIDFDVVETCAKRYAEWDYIFGKTISFTLSFASHFEWGSIELYFNVENGKICDLQIFTDSLDLSLPELIHNALINKKFEAESIKKELKKVLPKEVEKDIISLF